MHIAKYDSYRKTWSLRGAEIVPGDLVSIGGKRMWLDFVMPYVTRAGRRSVVHHMRLMEGTAASLGRSGNSIQRCICAKERWA